MDLTGYRAHRQYRTERREDAPQIFELTPENGGVVVDAALGRIRFQPTAEQINAVSPRLTMVYYDTRIIPPNGEPYYLKGPNGETIFTCLIDPRVTV
jgi:hypothetical protein